MIYFVRHGQTYDNFNNIIQGDGSLSEIGFEQVKETAKVLKDIDFDICFCSPLLRTRQTLNEIKVYHNNLKVIFDDRLKERFYGDAVGKHFSEVPILRNRWDANVKMSHNIESIDDLYNRVASFYDDIKQKYSNKIILIVAHSGIARMSSAYFYGKPKNNDYSSLKINNAEIIKLDF